MRRKGRGLRRKGKDKVNNKRTSCGPSPKHTESGTETVYIPNPSVWLLYHPPVRLPLIRVMVVLLLFQAYSDVDLPYTSPQDT